MSHIRVAMMTPPWLSIPPSGYGGTENVLAGLIPALLNLGVDIELFSTGDSTLPNVKIRSIYKESQYQYIHRPIYDSLPVAAAQALFSINQIRKDGNFDIIHDHNGFVGPLVLANTGPDVPPAIHTLHGPPFSTPDRIQQGIPDNLPMWRGLKSNHKLFLVPISESLASTAPKELKPMMLPAVHNSLDISLFPFVDKKDDYFMTLARFHPEKGQSFAVKACLELGARLIMAGGVGDIGNPKKLLLELANPLSMYRSLVDFRYYSDYIFPFLLDGQIENVGEIGGKRKLDYISHAKALLFPIAWEEPFGMAPIEALACGTPVIAMSRGALPEIIEHGVNGFLAKTESEFKKYMGMIDQIDPANCRKSVEKKFSAHVMAKRYLDRYQTALKRYKQAT